MPDTDTPLFTLDQRTPEQLREELDALKDFVLFLFPRWGQYRFTLHAPDALQERWSVWDKYAKATYALGKDPLSAVAAARVRLNHETTEAYKNT